MTHALGFAGYLLMPLIGIAVWRLDAVRRLALDGRLAIAGTAGALIVALTMAAMSIAGVHWSRTRLVLLFAIFACAGAANRRIWSRGERWPRQWAALAGIIIVLLITAYGLLTARETCGDLMFFWGPKGVHFFRAGKIDLAYLFDVQYFLGHRDYPPLLPLVFAWSHTVSRQFSWWAAVLFSGLCLAAIAATVRAAARSDVAGLLAAAALACAFASARVAGAADPLLLLFEATAAAALTFIDDLRAQWVLTAIGVAGAVLTKVEGIGFAVAVVVSILVVKRSLARATAVIPGALLIGTWLFVIVHYDMLDAYAGNGPLHIEYLPRVLVSTFRAAGYETYWLPWIVPLLVIVLGDFRRAAMPVAIAILTFGATIYFYLHGPNDPTSWWVRSSAPRVLLTPLVMLLIAAGASLNARSSVPAPATAPASHPTG